MPMERFYRRGLWKAPEGPAADGQDAKLCHFPDRVDKLY